MAPHKTRFGYSPGPSAAGPLPLRPGGQRTKASQLPQDEAALDVRTVHRAAERTRARATADWPQGWYRSLMGARAPPPVSGQVVVPSRAARLHPVISRVEGRQQQPDSCWHGGSYVALKEPSVVMRGPSPPAWERSFSRFGRALCRSKRILCHPERVLSRSECHM